jgi:hypothetical protein
MANSRCPHGDTKRYKSGKCALCKLAWEQRSGRNAITYAAIKADPDRYQKMLEKKRDRKRRAKLQDRTPFQQYEAQRYQSKKIASTGYTTTEAADRLRMENLSLLRGWSDLARIYNQPGFTGPVILPDNSRRWNRQQIDRLAQIMFQDQWKRKP